MVRKIFENSNNRGKEKEKRVADSENKYREQSPLAETFL